MPIVCPTITAYTPEQYNQQLQKVAGFAHRIQIDLTDGAFTDEQTVTPEQAWWPAGVKADFHLMYKRPLPAIKIIIEHQPNLIIVQAEAEGSFSEVANFCQQRGIRVGVALLPKTSVESILPALPTIDHVLVFSGNLGHQGGSRADFNLLEKVRTLKLARPEVEIGWDGGVNNQNISELVFAGVDIINVGGFIQSASDPQRAFYSLQRIADETGAT